MAGTTTNLLLPYPQGGDPANVHTDMQALATAIDALAARLFSTGMMIDFSGTAAQTPTGWLACDGTAVTVASGNIALRDFLIAAGNPYGVSGSDPKTPDMRGRVSAGKAAAGTFGTLGAGSAAALGIESQNITINELPTHTHAVATTGSLASGTTSGSLSVSGSAAANNLGDGTVNPGGQTGQYAAIVGNSTSGPAYTTGAATTRLTPFGTSNGVHSHSVSGSTSGALSVSGTVAGSGSATTITGHTGQTALSRLQPTVVVNKLIKL
jgi:microcystin-dependent protein